MPDRAPSRPSPERQTFWATVVEGLCVGACAHYPNAVLMELMADMHARRSQATGGKAGRSSSAIARPRQTRTWRTDMHESIQRLLRKPFMALIARTLLTLPFWLSGLSKLFLFDSGVAEMARAGLHPAVAFNIATIAVQLIGSALIIAGRWAWLGAGALGVFTGATILLVHRFWAIREEPFRTIALHVAVEHVGIIGGLVAIAVLSARDVRS
jgi:transmembrane protein